MRNSHDNGDPVFDKIIRNTEKPLLLPTLVVKEGENIIRGKQFFVIRGFMKSGTNWVCRLLNLHPEISCAGEFHWQKLSRPFINMMNGSEVIRKKQGLRHEMLKCFDRMIKECLVLANHPDARWVGDRTPAHIDPSLIRDSKIFYLIRDGRDVLVSRAYHFFNKPHRFPSFAEMPGQSRRMESFKTDPNYFVNNPQELLGCKEFVRESAEFWKLAIESDFEQTKELEQNRVMTIRYEQLHNNVEETRKSMYQFLGVDPELADSLTYKTKPGFDRERPHKFLRKGEVGDWKNYFDKSVTETFMNVAGDTMKDLGYL